MYYVGGSDTGIMGLVDASEMVDTVRAACGPMAVLVSFVELPLDVLA